MKKFTQLLREHLIAGPARKALKLFACAAISFGCASGCGLLGDKKEASRSLAQTGGACLDELGPLTNAFLDGNVAEPTWRATWDCVDDTIDLFKKFVQGSETTGYSPEDIRFLMQQFLFTKGNVTPGLVDGALALKASLFGGTKDRLTKTELDNFRALARFLRDETSVLIPHMRNRKQNPTPENLRAFATALETFGNRLADYLNTGANPKWTTAQAVTLTTELAKISFTTSPQEIEQWTRLGQELKTLLVRGATDGIAGADWTKILKYGFRAAGAVFAYTSSPADEPLFQIEMVNKIQGVLNTSIADWNDQMPFTQLEKIIDFVPNSMLPTLADDFRRGAKALLKNRVVTSDGMMTQYRPGFAHLLLTRTNTAIDAAAIERLVAAVRAGLRANGHLKSIFANTKEDLLPADFEARARAYMAPRSAADKDDVNRLITISGRYPGFLKSGSPEILFLDQSRHSLNNLNRLSWYQIAAYTLLEAYGTTSNAYGRAAKLDDLNMLIDDLSKFLYSVHMTHPLKPNVGAKRFREANLFMPNGNGDDLMDLPETTAYLAFIFSASYQNSRIMTATLTGEAPCPTQGWNIPLKLPVYSIQCFRNRFVANFNDLYMNQPHLVDELARMSSSEQALWHRTLEAASKTTGYNEDPITEFDIGSYAGLPHYAEAVMLRFDRDKNGELDRSEVLEGVFPVFKRELAEMSGIKIDFVNQAVLLYLMQYGEQPKVENLITFAISFDVMKEFRARRIRIYQIFAGLSPPSPADPISQTPPPGMSTLAFSGENATSPARSLASVAATPAGRASNFDLSTVDPVQLQGYGPGPVISPTSPYQEALEVLPRHL